MVRARDREPSVDVGTYRIAVKVEHYRQGWLLQVFAVSRAGTKQSTNALALRAGNAQEVAAALNELQQSLGEEARRLWDL